MSQKLFITAKPRAHENKVEEIDATHLVVHVKAPPVQGLANRAILQALAEYYDIPLSCLRITRGHLSRQKTIEKLEGV